MESSDPRAKLPDQAACYGCGSSAVACTYAAIASDHRKDLLCNTCVTTCAAGYFKKFNMRGGLYTRLCKAYAYTGIWCHWHKLVRDASQAISPVVPHFYQELPQMLQCIRTYYHNLLRRMSLISCEKIVGIL